MDDKLLKRGVLLLSENAGVGGIKSYVIQIAEGLRSFGIPVDIAAVWPKPDNWLGEQCAQRGFDWQVLAKRRTVSSLPANVLALAKKVRKRGYAIVHTQGHYSGLVARAAYVLTGKPFRLVATLHGMAEDPRLGIQAFYWFDWRTFHLNHAAIANSQDTANRLIRLGVRRPQPVVVHHGVVSHFEAERAANDEADVYRPRENVPPTIVHVGRLSREKGADILIEAAHLLKLNGRAFRVTIVGDGPERANLEALVARYGLTADVQFVGWQVDVDPYYRLATLVVTPSRRESLGLTVLEGMLRGRPVIACRVEGVPEIVSNGETGILIGSENPQELAQAIERLLDDPMLCHKLSRAGRQYVLRQHTIEGMANQTVSVYRQALEA